MARPVKWAELERVETLHESPSSEVFTARRSSAETVVIKRTKITEEKAIYRFRAEAQLLRECGRAATASTGGGGSAPIVALLGVIEEPPRYALVLPHFRQGSLYALLHAPDAPELPLEAALSLAADVLRAMAAVHGCGVVHRDVKPHNVLIADDGGAVLTDFGVAAKLAELDAIRDGYAPRPPAPSGGFYRMLVVGTLPYMAPELLRAEPASVASDVYAAGILCNEVVSGQIPYAGTKTSAEQMHTVIEMRMGCDSLARAGAILCTYMCIYS
ncbi:kinase-like domain-containing protein [Pavlovales sp. CCMP2436]|nr:kinase-like domain-containing protein [Pavlovales sp. CCMP2436]